MKTDILFVAWNRLAFTRASYGALVDNTDWDLVNRLYVVDDGSTDGTAEWLRQITNHHPDVTFLESRLGSPVAVMNDYIRSAPADVDAFVKLDNDILVPPGWLNRLVDVMKDNPELEVLGMQAGRETELVEQGIVSDEIMAASVRYLGWVAAPHIGGVGLMRLSAFRSRPLPEPEGRFGFTSWQQAFDVDKELDGPPPLVRGWIVPDIPCPQLDFLPFAPWNLLSQSYRDEGWQRYREVGSRRDPFWPPYDPAKHAWWDWMHPTEGDS